MKILNLYACLGGNRYKWDECADIEVTAVELDPFLAEMYQERFPNDKVVVGDAHQYLLDHYKEFDFIWSSPPCPTHSRVRHSQKNRESYIPMYPNMMLYEEIIFLENYFEGKYVVENVIPYYEPLIPPIKRGRHLYWTNFPLPKVLTTRDAAVGSGIDEIPKLCEFHEIDVYKYKGKQRKDKVARNLVDFEAGKTIFEAMLGRVKREIPNQTNIFDEM